MACSSPNADGTTTPVTTCSTKIGTHSATFHSGCWSPDFYGSVYKGTGNLNDESAWVVRAVANAKMEELGRVPGQFPEYGNSYCFDGTADKGFYQPSNQFGLDYTCPDNLFVVTRTVTAPGAKAADITFQAQVHATYAEKYGGQFKVRKLTSRRLGDQRRLASSEELTKGGWDVSFENTAEAPPDSSSSSASSDTNRQTETSNTAAIAISASALVVGAFAIAALFAGQRAEERQGRALELGVALASDEAVGL
jgi:hypothetical protein